MVVRVYVWVVECVCVGVLGRMHGEAVCGGVCVWCVGCMGGRCVIDVCRRVGVCVCMCVCVCACACMCVFVHVCIYGCVCLYAVCMQVRMWWSAVVVITISS